MTRPGARLRVLASRLLDRSTMERLIDPAIADLQHEHEEAVHHDRVWRGRCIRLAGYVAFWKLLVIAGARHALHERSVAEDRAVGRTVVFSVVAVIALTAVLVLPVLQSTTLRLSSAAAAPWLVLYSVPSALVVALPLGLVFGILLGLRNGGSTTRVKWTVTALGILCSAVAFIVVGWLMPATNQAFRELAARRQLLRGFNELTLGELASGDAPRLMWLMSGGVTVERLALEFHFRIALAFAPLALAMFSLGTSAAQRRVHGLITTALAAFVVCFGYYTLLNVAHQAIYRDSLLSAAPASMQWMPNLLVVLMAMLLLRRPPAAEPKESLQ